MQYKIPQNVGIEDKIVGPLTLRQLIILAVGCGISYVLFAVMSKLYELNILEYIIIVIPALFSVAFALIKINDTVLSKFILLFLEFSIKPKKRVWDHRGIAALVSPDLSGTTAILTPSAQGNSLDQKSKQAANLKKLTHMLDSGGFEHIEDVQHQDIDSTVDDNLVTQAYFGHKPDPTGNMYWRTVDSHKKLLDFFASLPTTQLKKGTKEAMMAKQAIADTKKKVETMHQQEEVKKPPLAASHTPPIKPTPPAKPAFSRKPSVSAAPSVMPPAQKTPTAIPKPTSVQTPSVSTDKKNPRKRNRNLPQPIRKNNQINTTLKGQPTQYLPKETPKPSFKPVQQPAPKKEPKGGEFDMRELEKGEIEINLD